MTKICKMPKRRRVKRKSTINEKRLIVGVALYVPLFLLSMARDFGLVGALGACHLGQLALFRSGDAGAVLCRLGLLRRRL